MWDDPALSQGSGGFWAVEPARDGGEYPVSGHDKDGLSELDLMFYNPAGGEDDVTDLGEVVFTGDRPERPSWDIDNLPGENTDGGPGGGSGSGGGGGQSSNPLGGVDKEDSQIT